MVLMLAGRVVPSGEQLPRGAASPRNVGALSDMPEAALDVTVGIDQGLPSWSVTRRQSFLRVRELGYEYAKGTPWARRALQGVDLDVGRGEGIVVTGDNGSGKSTLAWILAGLSLPTEGEVLLGGQPIVAGTGAVGISFQHARLQLIRPTVLADVAYGADDERAAAALRSVGLDPVTMGPRRVDELSGGEQRRVALAGLLVRDPLLLVLDEPYAGLDDEARAGLAGILARLRDDREMATVVVSHDLDNAELLGDRLVILEAGRVVGERTLGSRAPR
jgi:energy-coupling factor transport system ATP-binding protein